ncbi:MAG: hypothetical protein ACLSA2_00860 [Candidatus Gastranaerophilaceae bacterium]
MSLGAVQINNARVGTCRMDCRSGMPICNGMGGGGMKSRLFRKTW